MAPVKPELKPEGASRSQISHGFEYGFQYEQEEQEEEEEEIDLRRKNEITHINVGYLPINLTSLSFPEKICL